MKFLIIGLGNPGAEYEDTRHNVGFRVVDTIADAYGGEFSTERHGSVSTVRFKGNLSGKAVRYWMDSENIPVERILVVTDDLNLDYEKLRLRGKGSDGGHNGLKDIQSVLNSTVYPRLRVGIGAEFGRGQQIDFVLGKWTEKELLALQEVLVKSQKAVESFCAIGLSRSMNSVN
jgi:PTH1 family peptidyl-tRNA hydrolase